MTTTKKAHTQKSKSHTRRRAPFITGGVVLLALVVLFFARGWVRTTIIPKTATLFYLGGVQSVVDSQSASLNDPLRSLGFSSISTNKSCNLELAQSIHTEVDCDTTEQSYVKLPTGTAFASEERVTASLQSHLAALGWQAGSNGITLTSLIDGTAKGIDYSPDANYEKIVGKHNDCVLDVMIAYANPQSPAIRGTFSCDRTIDFLGMPKGQFYNSSVGHL